MTSLTKSKNMSGMSGRSSEHKHSHSHLGNDSDNDSIGHIIDTIKMETRKVGGDRLTKADFGSVTTGVWKSTGTRNPNRYNSAGERVATSKVRKV
jgi:hypothetical protein